MATPVGDRVSKELDYGMQVSTPDWQWMYYAGQHATVSLFITLEAYREHKYNDPTLHFRIKSTNNSKYYATNDYTHSWEVKAAINNKEGRLYHESPSGRAPLVPVYSSETLHSKSGSMNISTEIENYDTPINDTGMLVSNKFNLWMYGYVYVFDRSTDWSGTTHENRKVVTEDTVIYPAYLALPEKNAGAFPTYNGGVDVSDGSTNLSCYWKYDIVKAGYQNTLNWNPTADTGSYSLGITTQTYVNGTEHSATYTHNTATSSYTGYVKRYYTDYSEISSTSATATAYTYTKPTLSGISVNKSVISPRAGTTINVTYSGTNTKKWSNFENAIRSGLWSDYKSKYYTTDTATTIYLDSNNVKELFPDGNAGSNATTGKIYGNRYNTAASKSNPGTGTIYDTGAYSTSLKVQYKPTESIRDDIPSGGDGGSGIAFYRNENNQRGAEQKGLDTWVLDNSYDISKMTGVTIRLKYPKTDSSGVLSGYRIKLFAPNDNSPKSGQQYGNDIYWDTVNYDDYYTIPYDKLIKGISGTRIEVTPYYKASNGERWYGPTLNTKFVDIAFKLKKPVIDCPINNTTWHNHQYRILFKLPEDRDTNYNSFNCIEDHYGSDNYRYQAIQIKINGNVTTLNTSQTNARNEWISPVDVSKTNLTYLRRIIVNPTLLPNYNDSAIYKISIRVQKSYGQNRNFDGWSEWSSDITVNRKTVSNANVVRHEYITASHYMNVQTAFNNSLSCYATTASDNKAFVVKESFDRIRGDNINGPHLSPPTNTPLMTIREYLSEFNDLHQLKKKINEYGTFDTDIDRSNIKLDYQNNLLSSFTPKQEFITAEKDQDGAEICDNPDTILKGRNYMKYMCDEINHLY